MQKSVIYFKRTLPEKVIQLLVSISNDAFNNREGKIVGNRESTYCLSIRFYSFRDFSIILHTL